MCISFFFTNFTCGKKSKHGNLPFSRIFCSKKVIVFHDKKIGSENMSHTFPRFCRKISIIFQHHQIMDAYYTSACFFENFVMIHAQLVIILRYLFGRKIQNLTCQDLTNCIEENRTGHQLEVIQQSSKPASLMQPMILKCEFHG